MSARRYWISPDKVTEDVAIIDDSLYRHVFIVCKHLLGDKVDLLVGDGFLRHAEVIEINKKNAILSIKSKTKLPELLRPYINLYLSMPKYTKMDFIVEKSVELGVKNILPFTSDFSFIKSVSKISSSKIKRWDAIVRSACQQSGRGQLLVVKEAKKFESVLKELGVTEGKKNIVNLFAYEGASETSFKKSLQGQLTSSTDEVNLFVGSEGGFSDEEVKAFSSLGVKPVSFGNQVLRVETACVALISSIKYELS